jgi:hypothetical protein
VQLLRVELTRSQLASETMVGAQPMRSANCRFLSLRAR